MLAEFRAFLIDMLDLFALALSTSPIKEVFFMSLFGMIVAIFAKLLYLGSDK